MKLLYLYVANYRCFDDHEFNFDSNYRFHLENKNTPEVVLVQDLPEVPLPNNFWTSPTSKHNVVDNISAIIGENGSGKTTLAKILGDIIGYHDNTNLGIKYLAIFSKIKETKLLYISNFKPNFEQKNSFIQLDKENLTFIYYSPFFTTEHIFNLNRTIDISTSHFLSTASISSIKLEEHLANYKSKEYEKVLSFLAKYHDMLKKTKNSKISISLPQPQNSTITLEIEKAKEFLNNLIEDANMGELDQNIKKMNDELSGIVGNKGKKDKANFLNDKGAKKKQLAEVLLSLFNSFKKDFTIKVFLCYIVSFWRQYIKQAETNAFPIKFVCDSDSNVSKTVLEIVEDFIKYIENQFKIKPNKSESNSEKITNLAKIIDILKRQDIESMFKPSYVFFEALKELLLIQNVRIDTNIITCSVFDSYNLREKFLDVVFYYHNIQLANDFLSFGFEPNLSSGEMSILTYFSRIFDCLNNDKAVQYQNEFILFMDEAETTLHPEWQRRLVSCIIAFLENFAKGKKVHVIFASHSPILLSDIPVSNAIFLKKGTKYSQLVKHDKTGKTFGSNIYTLYKNSFFLNDGLMGEFATQKISDIFIKLKGALENNASLDKEDKDYIKKIIESIGEPLIKEQLLRFFTRATNDYSAIINYHDEESKRLKELRDSNKNKEENHD